MNKVKNMKKIFLIPLFFLGCNNYQVHQISQKSVQLLNKYGVNEDSLMKTKNGFIFVTPAANGIYIYKIDKNYNLIYKKELHILADIVKTSIKNDTLFILGYDQKNQKPLLIKYNLTSNKVSKQLYGQKYDTAKDFTFINKKAYIATTHYQNSNPQIVIYSKNSKITLFSPYKEDVEYILPFKKGVLIIGTIYKNTSYDLLIAYKDLNNKTVWAKTIDLGMDERAKKVEIKNNKIIITVLSTDEMGATKEVTFTLNEKGEVINSKKTLEIKPLPIKMRT